MIKLNHFFNNRTSRYRACGAPASVEGWNEAAMTPEDTEAVKKKKKKR